MTSFGWKRKVGEKVSVEKSSVFEKEAADEDDAEVTSGAVDWISLQAPKRSKCFSLEDCVAKSNRLKAEGATLAGADRFWEAIKKWDEALQLTPQDEKLYEMKAQAYMQLNEVFPALHASEKVVELCPLWWVGHQTLGRAQLGLGEVRLGSRSLCRAVHLAPDQPELIQEDLPWVLSLLCQKEALEAQKEAAQAAPRGRHSSHEEPPKLIDLSSGQVAENPHKQVEVRTKGAPVDTGQSVFDTGESGDGMEESEALPNPGTLKRLPKNYVYMRN